MRHHPPELGAAPLALAGVFFNTANVALTGYFAYDMFSGDPAQEFEASLPPSELEQCRKLTREGFTPSARAMAIDDLEGWRRYAQRDLAGYGDIAQAAAKKTIDNLERLYAQELDSGGVPVGPCHVYAGTFIIQRQLEALKRNPQLPAERLEVPSSTDMQPPPTNPKARSIRGAGLFLGLAAAAGALFIFSRS